MRATTWGCSVAIGLSLTGWMMYGPGSSQIVAGQPQQSQPAAAAPLVAA